MVKYEFQGVPNSYLLRRDCPQAVSSVFTAGVEPALPFFSEIAASPNQPVLSRFFRNQPQNSLPLTNGHNENPARSRPVYP
ncbi:hypothetical protein [Rufibacter sp. XAAS-G3-1]|uniref:hypothetical protein n=1 Tax=Rufibacter sp. XAAS-G3-1 TaxID=2729134 RepID=UPI0015E793AA|nr:hypothetical protein [Rufibacter sp. XAAS-G3-1]